MKDTFIKVKKTDIENIINILDTIKDLEDQEIIKSSLESLIDSCKEILKK